MPRKKKDGRFINYYIDRCVYERLERYADDKAQQMTAALKCILDEYLTHYEAENSLVDRYCPNCNILVGNTRCPACGKRWLDKAEPDDYCYLTEKDALWSGLFEDCLRQNGIPYLTQNTMGTGLTAKVGPMFETVRFFVKYAYYYKGKELETQLFAGTGQSGAFEEEV